MLETMIEARQEEDIEAQSKMAFMKLDPILKLLLSTIQKYQTIVGDEGERGGKKPNDIDNSDSSKMIISLLESQARTVQVLEKKLCDVHETLDQGGEDASARKNPSAALGLFQDYILLPIQSMLQYTPESQNNSPAIATAMRRCIQFASKTLTTVVKVVALSDTKRIAMICLCATTLSTETQATENKEKEKQPLRLDRGETYLLDLLRCIQTLMDPCIRTQLKECMNYLKPQISFSCTFYFKSMEPALVMEALKTMRQMIDMFPEDWGPLLPGCSAALFQLIISHTLKISSGSHITAEALHILALLLSHTLGGHNTLTGNDTTNNSSMMILNRLNALSSSKGSNSRSDNTKSDEFWKKVNQYIPSPLIVLLHLQSISSAYKIRSKVPYLCLVLLQSTSDTRNGWIADSRDRIRKAAVQALIHLMNDTDVAMSAREALDKFQQKSEVQWKHFVGHCILPDFLQVLNELPTIAQSRKSLELKVHLRQGLGYLQILQHSQPVLSVLVSPEVVKQVRHCFAILYDVDFESTVRSHSLANHTLIEAPTSNTIKYNHHHHKFRFLENNDLLSIVNRLAHSYGHLLGSKRALRFIDDAIADLHESAVERQETASMTGHGQVTWVHEWIGTIVMLNEIVSASFTDGNEKQRRKHQKRLKLLAGAVMERLITSPLWHLPTTTTTTGNARRDISVNALRGNAALLHCLLQFLGSISRVLKEATHDLLSIILFHLFEKCSPKNNHSHVRMGAEHALFEFALACGLNNVPELADCNLDYLVRHVLTAVRHEQVFGGNQMFDVVLPAIVILRKACQAFPDRSFTVTRSLTCRTNASLTIEMSSVFTRWLDKQTMVGSGVGQERILDFLELCDSVMISMAHSFGMSTQDLENVSLVQNQQQPYNDDAMPWMEWLEPFRVQQEKCPPGGFHKTTRADLEPTLDITSEELDYLSLALSRCGYYMSHSNLSVQVASCVSQKRAYQLLGYVAANYVEHEDELNGPKTAILRQIGESWSAFSSRLSALCQEFVESNGISVLIPQHAPQQPQQKPSVTNIVLLSHLLDLVGTMCSVSDDFMWGRLKDDVISQVVRLLRIFLRQLQQSNNKQANIQVDELARRDTVRTLTEKDMLLVAILHFVKHIFTQHKLVENAMPEVSRFSVLIFPFLDDSSRIGEAALDALKAMAGVDLDSIYRLLEQRDFRVEDVAYKKADDGDGVLGQRVADILQFLDGLPEQAF